MAVYTVDDRAVVNIVNMHAVNNSILACNKALRTGGIGVPLSARGKT